MRTLVVSDLHIGSHTKADVVRDPGQLQKLLEAVGECDRLIVLGDLLELRHGPLREALDAAREPLGQIGATLGPEREVIVIPGNHDHHLLSGWQERRGRSAAPPPLGLQSEVVWEDGDPLADLARLLAPARLRVFYPGLWLRDDVYLTHGHYLDLHLSMPTLERLGAGVMGRIVGLPEAELRTPEDYELVLAPIYAWIDALAQRVDPARGGHLHGGSVRGWKALNGSGRRSLRSRSMAAALPVLVALLRRAGIRPLHADVSGPALRRAGLRGMETAAARLGVQAEYVVFGHTHRAGPQSGDDPAEWRTASGTQLVNSGCWVQETSFLGPNPSHSPYRVGFGVWVGVQGPPELVNLLDARTSLRPVRA